MKNPLFVSGPHNLFLGAGIAACLISIQAIFHQWHSDYEFRILAIDQVCQQPLNNRCQYEYTAQHKDGTISKVDFVYMIERKEVEVGNSIRKEKFQFEYILNEKNMAWSSARHYLSVLFFGILALGFWRFLTMKKSNKLRN